MVEMRCLKIAVALFLLRTVATCGGPAPLVQPVTNPGMASVLASTRNGALAAGRLIGAAVPQQTLEDIAVIDASVLETPLDAAEQAAARDTIAAQYRENTKDFMQSRDFEHQIAQALLRGSPAEQMQARTIVWLGWLAAARNSPLPARWVATVKRHNSPVAAADGIVVTNRQLDALFVSNDWVAQAANLPLSTPQSRAAFASELATRFASMPQVERQQLAVADLRWDALRGVLNFGLKDKAVEIVHMNVRGPDDVPKGARHLEDAALQFEIGLVQFNKQMAAQTIAIMGGVADGAVAESINRAQDRFEGKFDVPHRH